MGNARKQVRNYVRNIIDGEYGRINIGKTIHFEIGNEFFWSNEISPEQYGEVALMEIHGINAAINKSSNKDNYKYEISVQSGNNNQDTVRRVARVFKNKWQRKHISHLTHHFYPQKITGVLGLNKISDTNDRKTFSNRLNDIRGIWKEECGVNVPFFLSEYNVKSLRKKPNGDCDTRSNPYFGLKNPMVFMSIFAEGLKGNVQKSTIWPITAFKGTCITTEFYSHFKQNGVTRIIPTTMGLYNEWLQNNIKNTHLIKEIEYNTSDGTFKNSAPTYIEAFKKGNDKVVLFVHSTKIGAQSIKIDFKNFKISKRQAEKLYVTRGQEDNPEEIAKTKKIWPKIWGNKSRISFTINSNSDYEVVKIVLTGSFQNAINEEISSRHNNQIIELPMNGQLTDINIYPNPVAASPMYINTPHAMKNITIYNLDGRKIFTKGLNGQNEITVSMQNHPSGIYLLVIQNMDGTIDERRIVKE